MYTARRHLHPWRNGPHPHAHREDDENRDIGRSAQQGRKIPQLETPQQYGSGNCSLRCYWRKWETYEKENNNNEWENQACIENYKKEGNRLSNTASRPSTLSQSSQRQSHNLTQVLNISNMIYSKRRTKTIRKRGMCLSCTASHPSTLSQSDRRLTLAPTQVLKSYSDQTRADFCRIPQFSHFPK